MHVSDSLSAVTGFVYLYFFLRFCVFRFPDPFFVDVHSLSFSFEWLNTFWDCYVHFLSVAASISQQYFSIPESELMYIYHDSSKNTSTVCGVLKCGSQKVRNTRSTSKHDGFL